MLTLLYIDPEGDYFSFSGLLGLIGFIAICIIVYRIVVHNKL